MVQSVMIFEEWYK